MSYERQDSTNRLEQYRARQAERIAAMNRAIDEGKTRVVRSNEPQESMTPKVVRDRKAPVTIKVELLGRDEGILSHSKLEQPSNGKKRPAAKLVSQATQPKLKVRIAAAIKPKDGQVFIYNAETGTLEPQNVKLVRSRGHARQVNATRKAFSSIAAFGENVMATTRAAVADLLVKK